MDKTLHQPLGGNEMPRFGGIATMLRLPHLQSAEGLDAAFIGVPLDIGTSLRSGTRFGPRQIRAESVMIRPYNMATGAAPFDSLSVADIGDRQRVERGGTGRHVVRADHHRFGADLPRAEAGAGA